MINLMLLISKLFQSFFYAYKNLCNFRMRIARFLVLHKMGLIENDGNEIGNETNGSEDKTPHLKT